jgi:hypothetical protein
MLAFEMRKLELQEEIAAKLEAEEAKAERMKRELAAQRAEEPRAPRAAQSPRRRAGHFARRTREKGTGSDLVTK